VKKRLLDPVSSWYFDHKRGYLFHIKGSESIYSTLIPPASTDLVHIHNDILCVKHVLYTNYHLNMNTITMSLTYDSLRTKSADIRFSKNTLTLDITYAIDMSSVVTSTKLCNLICSAKQ
jgi:hypothetical protein